VPSPGSRPNVVTNTRLVVESIDSWIALDGNVYSWSLDLMVFSDDDLEDVGVDRFLGWLRFDRLRRYHPGRALTGSGLAVVTEQKRQSD